MVADDGQRISVERIADAGSERDETLGTGREPLNRAGHQVNDVVRDRRTDNLVDVVRPATFPIVEDKVAFLLKYLQKLDDKKRIACSLLQD